MKRKTWLLTAAAVIVVALIGGALLISASQNQAPIRVACVGDSLTEGSLYPEDLWMLLGEGYEVENFGYHGTTVTLDSPTPYMHEAVFQQALQYNPDIVIIMLGTNDALPALEQYNAYFVEDYLTLVAQFKALQSKPQIYLVLPPPILNNGTGLSTEFFDQHIIPDIKEVAEKAQLPTINVYEALKSHPEAFPYDGVHPTDQGAQLIAEAIYKALTANR
jgi:lysophospholipase L1-like esterase